MSASKGNSPSLLSVVPLVLLGLLLTGSLVRLLLVLRAQVRLEQAVAETVARCQEQEILHPVYREILALDPVAGRDALVLQPRQPLRQDAVTNLSAELGRIAAGAGFVPGEILVQVAGEDQHRLLKVELPAEGAYRRLGVLLADLIRMPSLESLRRVSVQRGDGADLLKIELMLVIE